MYVYSRPTGRLRPVGLRGSYLRHTYPCVHLKQHLFAFTHTGSYMWDLRWKLHAYCTTKQVTVFEGYFRTTERNEMCLWLDYAMWYCAYVIDTCRYGGTSKRPWIFSNLHHNSRSQVAWELKCIFNWNPFHQTVSLFVVVRRAKLNTCIDSNG